MFKLAKAHELIYHSSILFPRLAVLYLYLRYFISKAIHYIIYATIILVAGIYLLGIIASSANCRPFSASWNHALKEHCTITRRSYIRFHSMFNLVAGALILLMPFLALRRVRNELSSRIALYLTTLFVAL
jgi:uncharacterized membrane protein YfbV (UPF0208 family)